jgi:hypothetical protein
VTENIGLKALLETTDFNKGVQDYMAGLTKMQAGTDKLVRGTATLKDAEGNMVRFSTSTAEAGKTASFASQNFGQMITRLAGVAVALGVVSKAKQFAAESYTLGRAQNDVQNALLTVVGTMDEYNRLITTGQEATRGMTSEAQLAEAGLILLKSGIATNVDEVGQLAAAGTALVNTYSNLGASQEKLTRFILSGNRVLLDNFNFTLEQVNAKTKEIEATTNLSGEEAKLAARKALVLEEGNKLLATTSAETVQVQQLTAAYQDFSAAFGQVLIAINDMTGAVPAVTGLFQNLTDGAKAWQTIITEQIPAIQSLKSEIAAQSVEALKAASTQEELTAVQKDLTQDVGAFRAELASSVDSYEEYVSLSRKAAQGNIGLTSQLNLTETGYNALRTATDNARFAAEEANRVQGLSAESLRKTAEAAYYAAEAQAALDEATQRTIQAGSALLPQTNRERAAYEAYYTSQGKTSDIYTDFVIQNEQRKRDEAKKAQEEQAKAAEKSAQVMTKSFKQAATDISGIISSVIQPTLSEVWQPPADTGRFDENARRLATVATQGFGSEWLNQLNQQFTGMDFWQPITEAMQSGDSAALQEAATQLLTNNVTALWDVEAIKSQVRQQLQQQQLRENIIAEVQAELMAEGGISSVVPAAVDVGLQGFEEQLPEFLPPWVETFDKMEQTVEERNWYALGKSIDDAVYQGIIENQDKVFEAIKSMFKEAQKQAAAEIGYGSPAREYIPFGASIDEGLAVGILRDSSLVTDAFDQLFNIDRSITDVRNVIGAAADDVEKFLDKRMSRTKTTVALRILKDVFRGNAAEILNATVPMEKFKELIGQTGVNWEKLDISQGDVMAAANYFLKDFNNRMGDAQAALQSMVVAASRSALDFASSLSDLALTGANQLNNEIDMLVQLLNTGASEFMLDGQIYSAAEATDLLNQKMQEQADIQDDLLQLQQSQAQLAFLEKQLDLIETIRQAGLDPADVLAGADLSTIGGLVTATNAAIQAIIGQVGQDINAYTPVSAGQTINNRSATVNMGGITVNNGMDINTLQNLIRRTVATSM